MKQYLLPLLVATGIGGGNALLGVLTEQPPGTLVAMSSMLTVLSGCLVWVIKHVLGKTIPGLQTAHAGQIERICQSFETHARDDRQLTLTMHTELVAEVSKLADGVRQSNATLTETHARLAALVERSRG